MKFGLSYEFSTSLSCTRLQTIQNKSNYYKKKSWFLDIQYLHENWNKNKKNPVMCILFHVSVSVPMWKNSVSRIIWLILLCVIFHLQEFIERNSVRFLLFSSYWGKKGCIRNMWVDSYGFVFKRMEKFPQKKVFFNLYNNLYQTFAAQHSSLVKSFW